MLFLFKIDFETFLLYYFTRFWFITLIMRCIAFSTLSLKWNKDKLESFIFQRRLRQGDYISSYLFVICMEKFLMLIHEKI